MLLVTSPEPGILELTWTWLPTWLGLNHAVKVELEQAVRKELEGKELTDELLERGHELVLDWLTKRFPNIKGLAPYLNALRHVSYE